MSPFGNGRCSHCEPAESRRWRSGKGGRFFATPPRQRRRHVGLIGPVPRRGGGGGGGVRGGCGCGDASHSDPDLGSNGRCRSGDGPPPEDGLWLGRSPGLDGPSGPSGGVLLGGTRRVPGPSPMPGVAWLLPGTPSSSGGTRRTTRKRWLKAGVGVGRARTPEGCSGGRSCGFARGGSGGARYPLH